MRGPCPGCWLPDVRQRRIVIETVADMLREGVCLFGTCGACRARKEINLVRLADEHGPETIPSTLAPRMRCACGHRGVELSVIPLPGGHGVADRH